MVKGNSFTLWNLEKGHYYKFIVFAFKESNGKKIVITSSKSIYIATAGGKAGNYKGVKVKKKKLTLKLGEVAKIKAKAVKPDGRKVSIHRKLNYESSNTDIVRVANNGKLIGVSRGTCLVYVYAQYGKFKPVIVTVK